jgi:hypothetical protein
MTSCGISAKNQIGYTGCGVLYKTKAARDAVTSCQDKGTIQMIGGSSFCALPNGSTVYKGCNLAYSTDTERTAECTKWSPAQGTLTWMNQ